MNPDINMDSEVCELILTQFCTSESIVIINSEYQNRM